MKCYYEILDVPREANDNEIKTAYRKLALKWHPDKNILNTQVAKEQFQLVQQAYEVLSDRQERAWYDNHREQILRGSDSNYKDDSLDVFPYFTTQCFKGYGDDAEGFYAVYRKVFEQITKEDIEHMESKSDYDDIPIFGNSTSDYEDVVGPFYAYWMSYSTRKSYVWLDPYNINEARERRVLKLIEKENKKVRQKAKKERNEEIRNLVAFVRKRDKRVQVYAKQLEVKNAENRQKQEQLRKQKLMERKKELHNDKSQAEWSKFDNVQMELKEIEKSLAEQFGECISDSDSNSVDDECEDLYCVACNKVFKNPKAFANHESSKKHRENVEKLKTLVREEEEEYEDLTDNEDSDTENLSLAESEELVEQPSLKKGNKKNSNVLQQEGDIEEINELSNTEENSDNVKSDSEETASQPSKKKNKKKKKVMQLPNNDEYTDELSDSEPKDEAQSDSEEIVTQSAKKKSKKNKKVIRMTEHTSADNDEKLDTEIKLSSEKPVLSDDDFEFGKSKKQKKKNAKSKPSQNNTVIRKDNEEINTIETATSSENTKNTDIKTINKKSKINKNNKGPVDLEDVDVSHCCVTCKSNFNSKNKLFEHLKKTGHSVMLSQKTPKSRKKNQVK